MHDKTVDCCRLPAAGCPAGHLDPSCTNFRPQSKATFRPQQKGKNDIKPFVLELKGMIDTNPITLHEHLSTLNCFV